MSAALNSWVLQQVTTAEVVLRKRIVELLSHPKGPESTESFPPGAQRLSLP